MLIFSHIPIFSLLPIFNNQNLDTGPRENLIIDRSDMLTDYHRLKELFKKHRNVKACLSGHIHLYDQVLYNGLHFVCDGAVSAKWWLGPHHDTREGFGVFDLHADGRFTHTYKTFDWKV